MKQAFLIKLCESSAAACYGIRVSVTEWSNLDLLCVCVCVCLKLLLKYTAVVSTKGDTIL